MLTCTTFGQLLTALTERARTDTHLIPLKAGSREVWPNETDYMSIRARTLTRQDRNIKALTRALTPKERTNSVVQSR